MAQICGTHPGAAGTIDGALVTFRLAMASNTMREWAASAGDVPDAAAALKDAATKAGIPYTAAVRTYLQDLDDLANSVTNPPSRPTKFIGDKDYAKLRADAHAVGC
jgi:hypothetical protein